MTALEAALGMVPAHDCAPPAIVVPPPPPGLWTCATCGTRFRWRIGAEARAGARAGECAWEGWVPARRGGRVVRVENLAAAYVHEQHAAAAPWWAVRAKWRWRRHAVFLRRLEGQR